MQHPNTHGNPQSAIACLDIIKHHINARLTARLSPTYSDGEMSDLILGAAIQVCKDLGDPAAANVLTQVREIAIELGRTIRQ